MQLVLPSQFSFHLLLPGTVLTRLVTECDEFYTYLCGSWEKVSINIITDGAATVQVEDNNAFMEHSKSNVYISAFITAYSRLKLYDEALDKLKS